ncbi:TatD family hydrolase [Pleomorphovibrio marinus]|uniref:TatD family hydrolase n=1 Tax=Pleomorphovibrio marinus TaxID=2164132 RepID=UPI000E0C5DA5|nr:TatD family hydrolase [Pleomorphovibrio marinus]
MEFIDTHAHIYSRKFDSDRESVIRQAIGAGLEQIYMPNIDLASIPLMLELEKSFPGICIPMLGLHPCDVKEDFEAVLEEMEGWLEKRDFAGIGETGLDLYWDKSYFEQQKQALSVQIRWAKKWKRPLILHCRESMEETIGEIGRQHSQDLAGIFHCFTGTVEQANAIIEMGFYLGIGGVSTFKNGGLDKVLPTIGLERLVLETDAPYLAPVPFRGKRNSPEYIPVIAQRLAEILDEPLEKVAEVTTANAKEIFKAITS